MELLNNDLSSFFTIWWCFPEFLLVLFISIFTGTLPFIKSEIKEWRTDNINHYNSNTFSAICINISLVITLIAVWSVDHGTFFGGQFINDANTSKAGYTHVMQTWIGDFNPKMIKVCENFFGSDIHQKLTTYRYLFDKNAPFIPHPII